jgi:hypothetical protein
MCGVNHQAFARPGYLIDTPCASIAAHGALFTRLLANYEEIGLEPDQILNLLDISRDFHERQVEIRIAFALISERLEHKRGRLDAGALAERKTLLDEHAELFRADEELFFFYAERGHALLSDEQLERIDAVYHSEKDAGLSALAGALNSAVGPHYQFSAKVGF